MKHTDDRIEITDAREERELRAVAALLRGLPDPETPDDLGRRVMEEVRRREARPRVLRVAFRHVQPLVATGLAAGVGALVLSSTFHGGWQPIGADEAQRALQPSVARLVPDATDVGEAASRPRIDPTYVALPGPGLYVPPSRRRAFPGEVVSVAIDPRTALRNPLDRRLDRDLNRLLLDPLSFYARVQRMDEPDRHMTRLVDRAAQRGDAAQIALRLLVDSPEHPTTALLVERLLTAPDPPAH